MAGLAPAIHVLAHQRKMWMPRDKRGHDGSADFLPSNVMPVVSWHSERNAGVGMVKGAAGARGYVISKSFRF
jgi:hypothetical protein